jgi:hypothetical protein
MKTSLAHVGVVALVLPLAAGAARAAESVWIEAENLRGVRGSCFPDMGGKTAGHWALSGPGIAPEWTQGGESGWLSVACAPDDDKASASLEFEVPEAGAWRLWVRYRDWRNETEVFAVRLEQPGRAAQQFVFGQRPGADVDEDDELKLLWKWAFVWDWRAVALAKGPAKLTLRAHARQKVHRQVDCFCLTTDTDYHPYHREKPGHATWQVLDGLRSDPRVAPKPLAARAGDFAAPAAWKPATFRDRGFLYLWNVGKSWEEDLASAGPGRVLFPYQTEPAQVAAFRKAYGGRKDVPIFSDPRVVPAFHGAGPNVLDNPHFVKWLEANPGRPWANMMNYIGPRALTPRARANWAKFRGRYVGNISGESLGHAVAYDAKALAARLKAARSRAEALAAFAELFQAGVAAKHKAVFGEAGANPYEFYIPCQSSEMTAFAHAARAWGARAVGYESSTVVPALATRLAFLRGSARQYGGLWATYRSSNFGDAATIYSEQSTYALPKYAYDNYYDVWAGAGSTWYKMDLWQQYMAGSALFYHEQGFDEFWTPGGGSTPRKPLQLSPKGRLVEQFLAVTRKHPDRGVPFTPVAFLLDQAHGWDPNSYLGSYFGFDVGANPEVLRFDRHARMLKEWFAVAYHPYGPKEAEAANAVNQNYLPGVFGDIFDVLVTAPARTDVLDSYPVVVLNGEVTVEAAWGKKLAAYLEAGGTLVVSDGQLTGPGVAALRLPELGAAAEDRVVRWRPTGKEVAAQRFRYRPVKGGRPLATAANGDAVAAVFERGKGRLVFLSVPLGLGIDGAATPLVALVLAHARQGLLPVEVEGEVEWLLNRTAKGWLLTLLNPAGNNRLQHGVGPTDYRQRRTVTIRAARPVAGATEWFTEAALGVAREGGRAVVRITVPAGGVRVVELSDE